MYQPSPNVAPFQLQAAKNANLHGNPVVRRDKASGSRVETQSPPTLYPAVHPFRPIPLFPLRQMYVYLFNLD